MKYLVISAILIGIITFFIVNNSSKKEGLTTLNDDKMEKKQENLKNSATKTYPFLKDMYSDSYFPKKLVDKGKAILVDLCFKIEEKQPKNLDELYELTHAATNQFNDLEQEFEDNNSEIETAARECIATDFDFVATSYGFHADFEKLIGTRNW
jgi:hypothetical protein